MWGFRSPSLSTLQSAVWISLFSEGWGGGQHRWHGKHRTTWCKPKKNNIYQNFTKRFMIVIIDPAEIIEKNHSSVYLWPISWTLPALFVGLQLVTSRLGYSPGCTHEPNAEEHEDSVHLHDSHSPADRPLLSVRIYSPPGLAALCLPETFPSPAPESIRGRKTATAAATLSYSTVWEENILWCLISTVGKAILTKPINPWASDGTDLIPPAADVPASLCSAVLRYPALWCALHSTLHRPETQILTMMQRDHL